MSIERAPPPNCAGCAFWRKLRENEGMCRRLAPEPSHRPEEAAHFPQTHSREWCGEGVAAASLSIGSRCADCVFWRHPDGGLNPVNRGDMPMSWWAHAGIAPATRRAPPPNRGPAPSGAQRRTRIFAPRAWCGNATSPRRRKRQRRNFGRRRYGARSHCLFRSVLNRRGKKPMSLVQV